MNLRLKRRIKILFCIIACSVIMISLFRELVYIGEIVKIQLKRLQYRKMWHLSGDGVKHEVDEDWFTFWNFTSKMTENLGILTTIHHASKTGSFNKKFLRPSIENSSIAYYINDKKKLCGGSFIGHAQSLAILSNVLVDPSKGIGRRGGENISDVINQNEESEYYKLSKGYFNLSCQSNDTDKPVYPFSERDHLRDWMAAVSFQSNAAKLISSKLIKRPTIAVQRYEYVNFYHTMTDFYNVFLMYLIFDLGPDTTNILWVDGHPKGGLDKTWKTLFKHIIRVGDIKNPLLFKTMIWNIMGYSSPIDQHDLEEVPYLEEFRHFFLTQHRIKPVRKLNCSSVRVSFIWRRDYLAHPRNPEGRVQRKIRNEEELISSLKSTFPTHTISGHQLDRFPMQQQLQHVADTDIFIGMHGAGLTHALFLPQHAALIELFPAPGSILGHFKSIAKWRGLKYVQWFNKGGGDPKGFTYVNPAVINAAVKEMSDLICPNENKTSSNPYARRKNEDN